MNQQSQAIFQAVPQAGTEMPFSIDSENTRGEDERLADGVNEGALQISETSTCPWRSLRIISRRLGRPIRISSPELVDLKVRALLNKLTMTKFDSISDQIIDWANRSKNEKDGRTLIQVIRLVFEKAIDEGAWNEIYARLCRKMMERISSEVQDDIVRNTEGEPIAGGQLFRKYLINRCQEDFERGWDTAKTTVIAPDNKAIEVTNEGEKMDELFSDEYYAAQRTKRQGLGLIKFIGELFKLQMLTERVMHECVKKLLGDAEIPGEEEIESLCQLLKTVGQLLDVPKARAHMNAYFTRMKGLCKSPKVSSRLQFMLQDVIELRDRNWVTRGTAIMPATLSTVHETAAREKAAMSVQIYPRQINTSRGRYEQDGEQNIELCSVTQPQPEARDLSQFGRISKATPMVTEPSSVFTKDDSPKRTSPGSNMFPTLSQNPELTVDSTTNTSRPMSWKPSANLRQGGAPEPVQRRKLQLLPRTKPIPTEETPSPASGEEPKAHVQMFKADSKKKIDEDAKESLAVHSMDGVDIGKPRRDGERDMESGRDDWIKAGGPITHPQPKARDRPQFGKISKATPMIMGPSGIFADGNNGKRDPLPQTSTDSSLPPAPTQNPERLMPSMSLGRGAATSSQQRKLKLLPRKKHGMPAKTAPHYWSEGDKAKNIRDYVEELLTIRSLEKADTYFANLLKEDHFRLVDKLVAYTLESNEADAVLVSQFFSQAALKGQCSLAMFEAGFMATVECLHEIAIDSPNAFKFMAMMMVAAGLGKDEGSLTWVTAKAMDGAGDKLCGLVSSREN